MELNINTPAYFNQHYGIDDEVYRFCQNVYMYFKDKEYSDIYSISINEILGGKRASGDKFTKIADENITVTLKGIEKNYQTFKKIMMCILALTTVLTITAKNATRRK